MNKYLNSALLLSFVIYGIFRVKYLPVFYSIFIILYLFLFLRFLFQKLKSPQVFINLGISFVFLDLIFRKIDLIEFFKNFRNINILYFIIVNILIIFLLFFRAYKWKYLISHIKRVKISNLFKATVLGFMANSILPARAGEVIRAYIISKYEKISKVSSFSTIVLERIFDGIVVITFFLYIILLNPHQSRLIYKVGVISSVIYIIFLVLLIIFYNNYNFFYRVLNRKFIPNSIKIKGIHILDSFYNGLHILRNTKELLIFTILTFILWTLSILELFFYFKCMKIFEIYFSSSIYSKFYISLFFTFIMTIGYAIPSGPGALGPLQASIILGFKILLSDFTNDIYKYNYGVSFAMFVWISQVIIQSLAGIIIMIKEGINFKELKSGK